MTKHRALNILLAIGGALIFASLLSTSYMLDQPSETQQRIDVASSTHDAQRDAKRRDRFEKAAKRLCGSDGYMLIADGEIQCFVKHVTKIAKVAL